MTSGARVPDSGMATFEPTDDIPEDDLTPRPEPAPDLPPDRYSNRELSWLAFNERVLALAEDPNQPLLERAKFLAIFASNLDEFYMVRIAGLKRRADMGLQVQSADGRSPRNVLAALAERNRELVRRHADCFETVVRPQLDDEGVHIRRWDDLDDDERKRLTELFETK